MKILRGESAIDGTPLDGCVVGVLGFGNQGRAHALNMRDSGCRVIVGARRDSKTFDAARELEARAQRGAIVRGRIGERALADRPDHEDAIALDAGVRERDRRDVVDGEKAIAQVEERDLSIANPHGAPLARWNIFSGCNPDPMFVIHARTFSMAWIVTNWVA